MRERAARRVPHAWVNNVAYRAFSGGLSELKQKVCEELQGRLRVLTVLEIGIMVEVIRSNL